MGPGCGNMETRPVHRREKLGHLLSCSWCSKFRLIHPICDGAKCGHTRKAAEPSVPHANDNEQRPLLYSLKCYFGGMILIKVKVT